MDILMNRMKKLLNKMYVRIKQTTKRDNQQTLLIVLTAFIIANVIAIITAIGLPTGPGFYSRLLDVLLAISLNVLGFVFFVAIISIFLSLLFFSLSILLFSLLIFLTAFIFLNVIAIITSIGLPTGPGFYSRLLDVLLAISLNVLGFVLFVAIISIFLSLLFIPLPRLLVSAIIYNGLLFGIIL